VGSTFDGEEQGMAICGYCSQEMPGAEGCAEVPIVIEDRSYPAVRFGAEPGNPRRGIPCGDCGVLPGRVHHHGCDVERCPRCHGQSISCGCVWAGEEHLTDDWVDEMEERLGSSPA
jgi:hypothetical protein